MTTGPKISSASTFVNAVRALLVEGRRADALAAYPGLPLPGSKLDEIARVRTALDDLGLSTLPAAAVPPAASAAS